MERTTRGYSKLLLNREIRETRLCNYQNSKIGKNGRTKHVILSRRSLYALDYVTRRPFNLLNNIFK